MPRLTYTEACALADQEGAPGQAVEGRDLECYSRAYMAAELAAFVERMGRRLYGNHRALTGHNPKPLDLYNPEKAWWAWERFADRVELNYSGSGRPGCYGFEPATRHSIGREGRQVAAVYLERRWRRAVFQAAGVYIPAELLAGCDPEEV